MWTYAFHHHMVNSQELGRLEANAQALKSQVLDQDTGSDALHMHVCRLTLLVEAMKRMMVSRGVMTDDEFEKMVLEIDLEDGVQDGLRTMGKVERMDCSQCGKSNRKRTYCYFCGQPLHLKEKVLLENPICHPCGRENARGRTTCLYCGVSFASGS